MNNKLSELSKPVAWANGCNETAVNALRYLAEKPRPSYGNSMFNTEHLYMIAREVERMSSQHLYSQEYVSALDKVAQFWIGESAGWKQRAEDAEKRIAELELDELAMRASSRAVHEAQDKRIAELEAKLASLKNEFGELWKGNVDLLARLATPVRLPTEHELHQVACSECAGNCLELVESTVRAAGFKCVGDE